MTDHVRDKVIIVTGAAGGFGRLLSRAAAGRGARVVLADIDAAALDALAAEIAARQGQALPHRADVSRLEDMTALAGAAVDRFGRIDVLVNNAGVMPLAFWADHAAAAERWGRCLDINIRGVMNGIIAVHDQMIAQGCGQVINVSSIYGNFPVAGAGIYGATKAAVNFLSESLRVESQGRIKVTTVRPTGVPGTGLGAGVINPGAIVGILGQNAPDYLKAMGERAAGTSPPERRDPEAIAYDALAPDHIADAILHAIDQPWGVSIGDITVRAAGDGYIL